MQPTHTHLLPQRGRRPRLVEVGQGLVHLTKDDDEKQERKSRGAVELHASACLSLWECKLKVWSHGFLKRETSVSRKGLGGSRRDGQYLGRTSHEICTCDERGGVERDP